MDASARFGVVWGCRGTRRSAVTGDYRFGGFMKGAYLLAGSILFAGGFVAGFMVRGTTSRTESRPIEDGAPAESRDSTVRGEPLAPGQRVDDVAEDRDAPGDDRERDEERRPPVTPAEALATVRDAIASGDPRAVHESLRALARARGERLDADQLAELAAFLGDLDPHGTGELARALVAVAGAEGARLVMAFVEDPEQTMEARRRAIHGLGRVAPENAGDVEPVLAAFLESGAPRELQHEAARALGHAFRERGAEVLLGLLDERAGVSREAVFSAIGDLGRPEDGDRLLEMLSGDLGRRDRVEIIGAVGRIAARAGNPDLLLDLLRDTPEGVSREMVARAIEHTSHDLGTSLLRDALLEVSGNRDAQEPLAHALARAGGRVGLDTLMELARDPQYDLDRRTLARALEHYHGGEAVPLMLDMMREMTREGGGDRASMEVIESLARGALRNGDARAVEDLLGMLERSESPYTRRALAHALQEGSRSNLPLDRLMSMLASEREAEVGLEIARAMNRLHPDALRDRAASLLDSAATPVERIAFADILRRQGTPGAASAIASRLRTETDGDARWSLAHMLGRLGEDGVRAAGDVLRTAPEVEFRHRVLWGLEASAREGRSAGSLRDLFIEVASSDPSPDLRAQAAEILGRQRAHALIPAVERLLARETHPDVRSRLEKALRELER